MDPVTMGLIAMGVSGGIKALSGLFDDTAQKKAVLMNKEADLEQSALEETLRRSEGQQTQVLSSTKSRMAGSGFDASSGSFVGYLSGMAMEFQKQNEYTREQGMQAVDLQRQAAQLTNDNALAKFLQFGADLTGTGGNMLALTKAAPGGGISAPGIGKGA